MIKKYEEHIIKLIAFIAIAVVGFYAFTTPDKAESVGGEFVLDTVCSTATTTTVATSTLLYLEPGTGTTTLTCWTGGTEQIDFNIFMLASSTLTDLRWRVEYSHSTSTVAGYPIFYPEIQESAEFATTTNYFLKEYRWRFASTTDHRLGTSTAVSTTFAVDSTGTRVFSLKDIAANWIRIEFYIPHGSDANGMGTTALGNKPTATSTNAGIYVHAIKRDPL